MTLALPLNPPPPPDRERYLVTLAPPDLQFRDGGQLVIILTNMDGFPPHPLQARLSEDGALAYLRLLLGSLVPPSSRRVAEVTASRGRLG